MSSTLELGTPSFEAPSKKKTKTYLPKLKEGNNIYRIIPPIFSCSKTGEFQVKHKVHFGFYGEADDSGKQRMRVFECPEEGYYDARKKVFNITKECAECKKIRDAKDVLKTLAAQLTMKGMNSDLANQKALELPEAAEMVDFLNKHNMDEKFYLNVLTQDDQIGLLKVPRGTGKDINTFCKEYSEKRKRDPMGVATGVWINISRAGKGRFSTTYKVEAHTIQKEMDGDIVDVPFTSVIPEETLARLTDECFDLHTLFNRVTCDEVTKMVNSGYDPTVIDGIFESYNKKPTSSESSVEDDPFSS